LSLKRAIIALSAGLAVAAGWCLFACSAAGRQLEWSVYDWHMRRRPPRPWTAGDTRIRLIAIDAVSTSEAGFGQWPWPRLRHAQLLQVLGYPQYRPKAVAFDVSFHRPSATAPQWDGPFVQMAERQGAVVIGYFFDELDTGGRPSAPRAAASQSALPASLAQMRLAWDGPSDLWSGTAPNAPWPELGAACWSGYYTTGGGPGVLRRLPLAIECGGAALPSLALAAVLRALGCAPADVKVVPGRYVEFTPPGRDRVRIPIDRDGCALVNYPSAWAGMDVTSYVYVPKMYLDATTQPAVAQALAEFKDSVVFVGMTYEGVPDLVATPLEGECPGVAAHAAMAWTILNGAFLREAPLWVDVLFLTYVSLLAASLATWAPVRLAAPGMPLLAAGAWGLAWLAFRNGLVLWAATPALAVLSTFAVAMVYRQAFTERRRRRLRHLFGQYLSPEAVREILNRSDELVLTARQMEAVVLFSDIRGFTALSERLGPVLIVEVLNEYFEAMTEIIQRHGGAVNKFVGDEIFALFGVPFAHPDDDWRAVQAAVEMQKRLADLRDVWRAQGRPELHVGIGLNRGDVIVASIGSERHRDYTAIGDAVNVGARLQELTKEHRERILVSQSIFERVKDRLAGRPIGDIAIRGRVGRVHVYAIDVPGQEPALAGSRARP
jgi:adenylate cyclase